jgi:Family of unknown function (DUF6308)
MRAEGKADLMKLASGLQIADPRKLLFAFVRHWYAAYDGVEIERDNELSVVEIALSMLTSRTSDQTLMRVFARRKNIEEHLAKIPDIDLLDVAKNEPLPGLEGVGQAITELCDIPRVNLSVSTKILHKKRPGLIPILDRFVESHYYPRWYSDHTKASWGNYAVDLITMVHEDMLSVGKELRDLQRELQKNRTPLTPCRILNVLTWIVKTGNEEQITKPVAGR